MGARLGKVSPSSASGKPAPFDCIGPRSNKSDAQVMVRRISVFII